MYRHCHSLATLLASLTQFVQTFHEVSVVCCTTAKGRSLRERTRGVNI